MHEAAPETPTWQQDDLRRQARPVGQRVQGWPAPPANPHARPRARPPRAWRACTRGAHGRARGRAYGARACAPEWTVTTRPSLLTKNVSPLRASVSFWLETPWAPSRGVAGRRGLRPQDRRHALAIISTLGFSSCSGPARRHGASGASIRRWFAGGRGRLNGTSR